MPTDPKYEYDVFISYKSEDRPWADKLYSDLQSKGLVPFIDHKRLEAGREWEPQLAVALGRSEHLVVLWSDEADRASWVRKEIGHFDTRIHAPIFGQEAENSRMIFVLLEGAPKAYTSIQAIADLRDAGVYDSGVESASANLWTAVAGKIQEAIQSDDPSEPVLLDIIALTKDRFDEVDSDAPHPGGFKSLAELLSDLALKNLKNLEDLKEHYGDTPQQWQPLGSEEYIKTMLDTLRDEINKTSKRTFRWEPVGDTFWGSSEDAERETKRLASNWSVVVIDPLSFYHSRIQTRFGNYYHNVLANPRAVFMALPPFGMLMPYAHYRSLMAETAKQVFDRFYDPPMPGKRYARCNVNIVDQRDIKQYLLTTVGSELLIQAQEPSHPALGF